jgi:uncharacterized membrane protein
VSAVELELVGAAPALALVPEPAEAAKKAPSPWRMVAVMGGAGVTHFTNPDFYEAIVPRWLPGTKRFWVQASGVAELACTALLIPRRTRRIGGWLTLATLISVYPANIQVALDGGMPEEGPLNSAAAAWVRLPFQLPMMLDAIRIARKS